MRTCIRDVSILTMVPGEPPIDEGYLVIDGESITAVQAGSPEPSLAAACDEMVDGRGRLALPGFINAHTHVGMMPFRNYASDLPLQAWLFDKLFPVEDKLTEEDVYWAAQVGIAEMIRTGTTCFADMYMFADTLAAVVEETGVRADISRGLQCFDESPDMASDHRMQEALDLYHRWHGRAGGRITVRFGPHAVYTCTPGYLREVVQAVRPLGAGIHIHLSETQQENTDCQKAHGRTPTQHLAALGLFELPTLAAHGVYLSAEDRALLARCGAAVVHNPGSNLKLGSGTADVRALLDQGITTALGTDGAASNNNLDMLQEVYLAAVLSKPGCSQAVGVTAAEALEMGTAGGAQALGFSHVGQLQIGKQADVILVNVDQLHYTPLNDPVAGLVYAGHGSDVETVYAAGRCLYHKGEHFTIDVPRARTALNAAARRLLN